MGESPYLREIRRLDPVRDRSRIVYLDTCFEFPWDTTRSLELALFRTFASPAIAELLDGPAGLGRPARKRTANPDWSLPTMVGPGTTRGGGRRGTRRMTGT